ncbi:hypothetical protein OHS33_20685 [Streptomyces sp. NBC_00536]|uniref:hypothetical protein n=1 Tax=Streptomyces sp. NBC_00536 TaxID=2975769 RepID=UPI002E820DC9|nr:hypothetical protein [Streptomyces sp. NBC_00536]WUC80524.1 hypothetical protein OHS33_20685 [Streptomyces sp. NBC_00536]
MLARRVRFGAVVVAVVFALTGFSSSGKHKSSGGHGCSSSKSSHRTSTSGGTSSGTTSGSSGSSRTSSPTPSPTKSGPPAHAVVVSCAGPASATATVQVTSDVDVTRTVTVPVVSRAEGVSGDDYGSVSVTLKARETRTVTVKMGTPADAAKVRTCRIGTIS